MMNLALMLLAMNAAQARDVKHYIAVCGNGDVLVACTQPFCDDSSAYYKAREVCANRKGASDLLITRGPRNAFEALVPDVEEEDRLREEARKSEELRLQEEARKAEEARKVAEAREAEVRECEAKMTYIPPAWACPFGDYVSDPNDCSQLEGKTRSGDYAVQVDLGLLILPPGVSCPLRVDRADTSHERLYGAVLNLANFSYNGEERPEGFDFDVNSPVNQALANWQKAEDRRLAAIPYDCLAGVCLNTPATRIADKLVTVSEVVMHRTVEVCSGRVVRVEVSAGWHMGDAGRFVDILPGAQRVTYNEGWPALNTSDRIRSELSNLGWRLYDPCEDDDALCSPNLYVHPDRKGDRWTDWERTQSGDSWYVTLMTTHPDYRALCAPKRQQGL